MRALFPPLTLAGRPPARSISVRVCALACRSSRLADERSRRLGLTSQSALLSSRVAHWPPILCRSIPRPLRLLESCELSIGRSAQTFPESREHSASTKSSIFGESCQLGRIFRERRTGLEAAMLLLLLLLLSVLMLSRYATQCAISHRLAIRSGASRGASLPHHCARSVA